MIKLMQSDFYSQAASRFCKDNAIFNAFMLYSLLCLCLHHLSISVCFFFCSSLCLWTVLSYLILIAVHINAGHFHQPLQNRNNKFEKQACVVAMTI